MQLIDLAINLINERERLGYSRKNFAAQTNVSSESLRLYESGKVNMSAEFLLAATKLGVDIQFIFTGIRSMNLDVVSSKNKEEITENVYAVGNLISGNVNNSVIAASEAVVHHTQIYSNKRENEKNKEIIYITDKEIRNLQELVRQIVETEKILKKKPRTARSVWQSLSAYCNTSSYKCIALKDYEKAETYLKKWLSLLTYEFGRNKLQSK
ncbi:hypothetical protein BHC44_02170 [Snodgrassella alvi]|nr:hypothetical protein BHC44_02170 [Snodgrassella alvi]